MNIVVEGCCEVRVIYITAIYLQLFCMLEILSNKKLTGTLLHCPQAMQFTCLPFLNSVYFPIIMCLETIPRLFPPMRLRNKPEDHDSDRVTIHQLFLASFMGRIIDGSSLNKL